ncbi:MAG: hypothetical protein A3F14_06420 [Gammaproteobacteria bacterium RIFCSPHIGHO2_12_FULL_43_28]|nr:MAG: hypothetical protein A3F14_06420 [Gammaproteobacteria bacterium RIFCSPHIGHO2_12_FULL_43_28]
MKGRSIKEAMQEQLQEFSKLEHDYNQCAEGIAYLNLKQINRLAYLKQSYLKQSEATPAVYPTDYPSSISIEDLLQQEAKINIALGVIEGLRKKIKATKEAAKEKENKKQLLQELVNYFVNALPLLRENQQAAIVFNNNYQTFRDDERYYKSLQDLRSKLLEKKSELQKLVKQKMDDVQQSLVSSEVKEILKAENKDELLGESKAFAEFKKAIQEHDEDFEKSIKRFAVSPTTLDNVDTSYISRSLDSAAERQKQLKNLDRATQCATLTNDSLGKINELVKSYKNNIKQEKQTYVDTLKKVIKKDETFQKLLGVSRWLQANRENEHHLSICRTILKSSGNQSRSVFPPLLPIGIADKVDQLDSASYFGFIGVAWKQYQAEKENVKKALTAFEAKFNDDYTPKMVSSPKEEVLPVGELTSSSDSNRSSKSTESLLPLIKKPHAEAVQPKKPNWFKRHPIATGALIGLGIGLGVTALAVGIGAALFFTGGAAAPFIAGAVGLLIAKATLGGAVGVAVGGAGAVVGTSGGLGAAGGAVAEKVIAKSSTAKVQKKMGGKSFEVLDEAQLIPNTTIEDDLEKIESVLNKAMQPHAYDAPTLRQSK